MVSVANLVMLAATIALAAFIVSSAPSQGEGMTVIATVIPA